MLEVPEGCGGATLKGGVGYTQLLPTVSPPCQGHLALGAAPQTPQADPTDAAPLAAGPGTV